MPLLPDPEIHATLVSVRGRGLLLTGPSGAGKSRLALALVERGHALVVDDSPRFEILQGELWGHGRGGFEGRLHLPESGILDLCHLYGDTAFVPACRVRAAVRLRGDPAACRAGNAPQPEPLSAATRGCTLTVRSVELPCLTLAPGEGRALRVETWLEELTGGGTSGD